MAGSWCVFVVAMKLISDPLRTGDRGCLTGGSSLNIYVCIPSLNQNFKIIRGVRSVGAEVDSAICACGFFMRMREIDQTKGVIGH